MYQALEPKQGKLQRRSHAHGAYTVVGETSYKHKNAI